MEILNLIIWIFVCLCPFSVKSQRDIISQIVGQQFTSHEIVPDLIPKPPTQKIDIVYTSSRKIVYFGNKLKPSEVIDVPSVTYRTKRNKFYTLAMLDPDAPSRENPTARSFVHWLVGNIPQYDVARGETLVEYFGSTPAIDSGYHRYTFLLYEHNSKIEFKEIHLTVAQVEERNSFSILEFTDKYNLGHALAGNFFLAEHET